MAHKTTSATKAGQGANVAGKRLGIKVAGGSSVKSGQIIVRQRGRTYAPGLNTGMGRDFTIFSKVNGSVEFINKSKVKKQVNVVPSA